MILEQNSKNPTKLSDNQLPETTLTNITDSADPNAQTNEKLRCIVQVAQPSARAWLEIELNNMQEAIVSQLYVLFKNHGIELEDRLAIGVNPHGDLEIYGHPQRAEIMRILENNSLIHKELCIMAVMALTERGLGDLAMAKEMLKGDATERRRIFQACLKGALAHFHLVN